MANITIYLKVDEVGLLHLRDSEGHSGEDNISTDANDGDVITWTLEPDNPGIRKITGIAKKEGSEDLFSNGPKAISDTVWQGTIKQTANGEESYYIEYVLADGTPKKDDPLIFVPPR